MSNARNLANFLGTSTKAHQVINTTGTISTTTSNTTNGTFLNSSGHNTANGVVHVKQSGATNLPTMVLEQTGEGGNPGDKQGLHIKNAGQNQGDGQVIAVTTTNSNLNSGNAFDSFRVFNNGAMSLLNGSTTLFDVTSAGYLIAPQTPMWSAQRSSTRVRTSNGYTMTTDQVIPFSNYINNGNHVSSNIFTVPYAGKYHCTLFGLFYSSSSTWVAMYTKHNSTIICTAYNDVHTAWQNISSSTIIQASANDTIRFNFQCGGTDVQFHEGTFGGASISLIA